MCGLRGQQWRCLCTMAAVSLPANPVLFYAAAASTETICNCVNVSAMVQALFNLIRCTQQFIITARTAKIIYE